MTIILVNPDKSATIIGTATDSNVCKLLRQAATSFFGKSAHVDYSTLRATSPEGHTIEIKR